MKISSIFASLLLTVFLFSCKNETKEQNQEAVVKEEKKELNEELFTITMNAVVKKDDTFQVFYKDEEKGQFLEDHSVHTTFKGSDVAQDIQFVLPKGIVPNYLRFDFGVNKEQSEIVINSVKLDYLGQNFTINNKELANFISFNSETLKFNQEKGSIEPFVSKDGTYDPMSFTAQTLYEKIQILKQ
ncbi:MULTISPECIES: hypothetical protein [Flavobacterium]|uniref:hypothetical protein n=1 Tax=Flavobacterium TaxID=237 RepID=UPI0028074DD9|nr:hypothetical protein [Flavobacterium lindanitolerans]MDQ7959310.1 hypothetical protein [Flavobacterium lindanitolerans]